MTIKYKSTRGKQSGLSFEEVVLGGLATDKGLYVPEKIPNFSMKKIEEMRSLSYIDLAYEVISSFVGPEDVPSQKLKEIIEKSFSTFRTPEVAPVVKLQDFWVLELFHGPTFAFKDVALQFLGNLFEFFLERGKIQQSITILGATSGDTGSAAIHGLRGKRNVSCFIMFPLGKVTEIQERQMTTIPDENIHCLSIKGDFDDCQAIVKAAFADSKFRDEVKLGAINSINWARVLAQITYYFYSYLRVTDGQGTDSPISLNYAVPTGNFGDILAGYYAKRMGLPVDQLVVCTNENDVLHRFLSSGVYQKNPAVLTIAPSMDISVSSNFERYLYYLAEESGDTLAGWMETFETSGQLSVSPVVLEQARQDFSSFSSDRAAILKAMRSVFEQERPGQEGYLVCPHTATAVVAANALKLPPHRTVCLATAHPAKFEEAEQLALSVNQLPKRPEVLDALFRLKERKTLIPRDLKNVQDFVRSKLKGKSTKEESFLFNDKTTTVLAVAAVVVTVGFTVLRFLRK